MCHKDKFIRSRKQILYNPNIRPMLWPCCSQSSVQGTLRCSFSFQQECPACGTHWEVEQISRSRVLCMFNLTVKVYCGFLLT